MFNFKDVQSFVEAFDNSKKVNLADLSSDQDLAIGLMNLIAIEEHLFFSGAKTENYKFYEMIEPIREIRKDLLKKIVGDDYEGETWCITKHLLSGSMRLMEVGVKQQSLGNTKEAYDLFEKSYNLYCLVWAMNLKIENKSDVDKAEITNFAKEQLKELKEEDNFTVNSSHESYDKKDTESINNKDTTQDNKSNFNKFKLFLKKAMNCCRE